MAYRRSQPLSRWLGERATIIETLAAGHAAVGAVSGPGRPLDISKPLAHAYVIVMLREFQGFIRDLHDLTAERLVSSSSAHPAYGPLLIEGLTKGRAMDRGNATDSTVKADFARLGLTPLDVGAVNDRWKRSGRDAGTFHALIELRNALGHGNVTQLRTLIVSGRARDSVTWARGSLPVLNRYASALDHLVWDHLEETTGSEPWT